MKGDRVGVICILDLMDDAGKDQYGHLAVQVSALRALQTIELQEGRETLSPRTEARLLAAIMDKIASPDWCVRREVAICLRTCSNGSEEVVWSRALLLVSSLRAPACLFCQRARARG